MLPAGGKFTVALTATPRGESNPESATVEQQLYVNLPPSSGTCQLATIDDGQPVGEALKTEFKVKCSGWVDDGQSALSKDLRGAA